MKQYIKTVAMALVAGLGLVACNDNEDFEDYKVSYPSEMPTGYFVTDYAPNSKYNYGVLIRTSETDTVFQIVMEGKSEDAGYARTIASTDEVSYDSKLGMVKAVSSADANFYEQDIAFYVAYTADSKNLMLNFKEGNHNRTAMLKKATTEVPPVAGTWNCENEALSISVELLTDSMFNDAKDFIGWKASMSLNGAEPTPFAYKMTNASEGTFDFNGIPGTFKYDDNYNLVVSAIGQNFVCNRAANAPEPEIFVEVAYGQMLHGKQILDGQPLFTDQYEAVWAQSEQEPSRYLISPWLNNANGIVVTINPSNNKVSFDKTFTGITHPQAGPIYGEDISSMVNFGDGPNPTIFDGKVVNLFVGYSIPAGMVSFAWDAFTIKGAVEASQKKVFTVANGKVKQVK